MFPHIFHSHRSSIVKLFSHFRLAETDKQKKKKEEQVFFDKGDSSSTGRCCSTDHNLPGPCEVKLLHFLTEDPGNFLKDAKVLLLLTLKPLDLFSGVGRRRLTVLSFKLSVYDVKENELSRL